MSNFTITYVVSSDSSEQLVLVRQLVADKVRQDSLHTDVGTAKDRVYVHTFRIEDYFTSVQVADVDPSSFRIDFTIRPDADRYWKDVVVKIVTSVKDAGASISLKGN